MLKVTIERIGDVAVIHCEGRVVQSAAAFRLRDAVTQQVTRGPFWSISRMFSQWKGVGWECSSSCSDGQANMGFNSRSLTLLPLFGKE
jgi:hypothetical protein